MPAGLHDLWVVGSNPTRRRIIAAVAQWIEQQPCLAISCRQLQAFRLQPGWQQ
jgi:hypothetical protein